MSFYEVLLILTLSLSLFVFQYLNRGCTRFFATKDTDKQILQNRKSPEVKNNILTLFDFILFV